MYLDGGNVRTTTYSTGMKNIMIINHRGLLEFLILGLYMKIFSLDC